MTQYSIDEIKNIAHLAKLAIKEDEIGNHAKIFSNIINMIEKIRDLNTEDIQPMSHPFELNQRLRPDAVTEKNQRELFQSTAPQKKDGLYLVPQVIE